MSTLVHLADYIHSNVAAAARVVHSEVPVDYSDYIADSGTLFTIGNDLYITNTAFAAVVSDDSALSVKLLGETTAFDVYDSIAGATAAGTTLLLSDLSVSGNSKYENVAGNTLHLIGDGTSAAFSGNSSAENGGAIRNYGTMSISGMTFLNDTGRRGGAISSESNAHLSVYDTTFIGCVTTNSGMGSAVHNIGGNVNIDYCRFFNGSGGASVYTNNATITVSNSLFVGNSGGGTGSGVGGNRDLTVSGSTFVSNTSSAGVIVNVTSGRLVTITGSTFVGNSGGGAAAYVSGCGLSVSDSVFDGNVSGAVFAKTTANATITGCTFLTASDTIKNDAGDMTIAGVNYVNAGIINGEGTITVDSGAGLVFGNAASIDVAGLTFAGSNAVTFNGKAAVNFTSQNLSGVSISVGSGLLQTAGESFTIASGISGMSNTITAAGQTVTLGQTAVIGGGTYTFALESGDFTVSHLVQTVHLADYIHSDVAAAALVAHSDVPVDYSDYAADSGTLFTIGNDLYITNATLSAVVSDDPTLSVKLLGETTAFGVYDSITGATAAGTTLLLSGFDTDVRLVNAGELHLVGDGSAVFAGISSESNGGAISSSNAQLTVSGMTFLNDTGRRGGGISSEGAARLDVYDVTFIGCASSNGRGSGVYASGGTLTVDRCRFYDGDSTAAYSNGATITISDSLFVGNYGGGSGSCFNGTSSVTISGSTFVSNTSSGGVITLAQSGKTATITGSTFTGNLGSGAAAYVMSCGLNVSDTVFDGNASGAVYANKTATSTITGCTFLTASDTILNGAGDMTIAGVNYINAGIINGEGTITVASGAGLVFGNAVAIDVAGLTFAGSNAVSFNGRSAVNFTSQNLSGVSISVGTDLLSAAGMSFTIASGVANMGGAITVAGQTVTLGEETVISGKTYTFALESGDFTVSRAGGNVVHLADYIHSDVAAAARVVHSEVPVDYSDYIADSGTLFTIGNDLYITNTAFAAVVSDDPTLSVKLLGETTAFGVYDSIAGATAAGTTLLLSGFTTDVRYENPSGASLHLVGDGTGAAFAGINFTSANGGAIENVGTLTVSGMTFLDITGRRGGAISSESNAHLNVYDVTFIGCAATNSNMGSGVYNISGNVDVDRCRFLNGTGMSVYANNATITVSDSLFVGNDGNGSASGVSGNRDFTVSGSTFTNNTSESGVIVNTASGRTVTVSGSTFTGNFGGGSAIRVDDCTLSLSDSVFDGNVSGAVYARKTANATITGCTFLTAGDIIKNDAGNMTIAGVNCINAGIVNGEGTITVASGAGLVFGNAASIDVAGLTFAGSNAVTLGGAACVNFTDQDLSAVSLTVDAANYAGEAITVATGVTAIGDYTITNKGAYAGLDLYSDGNGLFLTDGTIVQGFQESFTGGTNNLLLGGTVSGAFVAIRDPGAGVDVQTIISTGTVGNAVIGGALVSSGSQATLGTVTLDIVGDADVVGGSANGGMLYTAGYAYGASASAIDTDPTLTVEKAVLNLTAGSIPAQNLYAGAHARKGAYTYVAETEVNVSGGSFGRIYGGGWAEKTAKSVVGSSTITVSGGSLDYIYAGGANGPDNEGGATIVGDVTITVSGDASVGFAFLAGKNQYCSVGDVTMTLTGDAKTMTRVSGYNACGTENLSTTTLDLQTSLNVDYLDHVDVIRIAEGKTLNVGVDIWHEASAAVQIDFDLDGVLDTDWTAMSGVGMDLYKDAQYTIDGGSVVYTYDSATGALGDSGYGLDFSEANKVKFITLA